MATLTHIDNGFRFLHGCPRKSQIEMKTVIDPGRPGMHPLRSAALCALALLVAACGGSTTPASAPAPAPATSAAAASEPIVTVVASTNVYGDIARQVGGDRVEGDARSSPTPARTPHSYEANTPEPAGALQGQGGHRERRRLRRLRRHHAQGRRQHLRAGHQRGHRLRQDRPAGGELNEHIWYDLPSVAKIADQISTALTTADPPTPPRSPPTPTRSRTS